MRIGRSERYPAGTGKPQRKNTEALDVSKMYRVCHPGDANTAPFQTYGETLEIALERFNNRRDPVLTGTGCFTGGKN